MAIMIIVQTFTAKISLNPNVINVICTTQFSMFIRGCSCSCWRLAHCRKCGGRCWDWGTQTIVAGWKAHTPHLKRFFMVVIIIIKTRGIFMAIMRCSFFCSCFCRILTWCMSNCCTAIHLILIWHGTDNQFWPKRLMKSLKLNVIL